MNMNGSTSAGNNRWLIFASRMVRWAIGLAFIYFGDGWKGEWPALIVGVIFFVSGFLKPRGCVDGACDNE